MSSETDAIAVSIQEAGRLVGFKRSAAYDKFTRGEIPGLILVGKNMRVSVEVLREWVKREASLKTPKPTASVEPRGHQTNKRYKRY